MVKSFLTKLQALRPLSMLHLLITEVLNRKKDTMKITVATNRSLENLQFYFNN